MMLVMTLAPAITRVHKLFRLRTVVNDAKGGVTSHEVAEILVNRHLSAVSTLRDQDHERRARDHVMNCILLGLLRKNASDPYVYEPTSIASKLSGYKFDDGCPKDIDEMALFADRLCRLKLDNVQLKGEAYDDFRVRPLMNILRILENRPIHIYQIHYLLSARKDFIGDPATENRMKRILSPYVVDDKDSPERFFKNYIKNRREEDEAFRSTKPLLDWCQQAGLVYADEQHWYRISEKGISALRLHKNRYPVWYEDFGFDPNACSSIALALNAAFSANASLNVGKLSNYEKTVLKGLHGVIPIQKTKAKLTMPIVFELEMDIPYSERSAVQKHAVEILKKSGMPAASLSSPSMNSITEIKNAFALSTEEKDLQSERNALGVELPRPEQFQIKFEYDSCVRLIVLGFKAGPYKGEFAGQCDLRIAADNPDAVIRNSLISLVECKSKAEWGDQLKLHKTISSAFDEYQRYAEEVKANSALFVLEATRLDEDRYMNKFYSRKELDKIVIVSFNTLIALRKETARKKEFEDALEEPNSFSLKDRIFYN